MNRPIAFFILILLLCSCQNEQRMLIEGQLRTDRDFTGEMFYLLPMEGDQSKRDSALIEDGRFSFNVNADSAYIAMIRPKNMVLSYFLQPLLVAVEAGTLEVRLDSVSRGSGTPLNDALQDWKERKTAYDSILRSMRRQLGKADGDNKARLAESLMLVESEYSTYNHNFVEKNRNNPVGRFVGKTLGMTE